MAETVEYGVAVQEDELADEHVVGRTDDRAEALDAARRMPFTRAYLVQRTATGWEEVRSALGRGHQDRPTAARESTSL